MQPSDFPVAFSLDPGVQAPRQRREHVRQRECVFGVGWPFSPGLSSNSTRRPRQFDWTSDRADATVPITVCMDRGIAEGIDLPGAYCRHVVIAKLPFAVPDDPIAAAHSELLEALGELLIEQRDWDRLRAVFESAIDAGTAAPVDYDALANLVESRYRDVQGAAEVFHADGGEVGRAVAINGMRLLSSRTSTVVATKPISAAFTASAVAQIDSMGRVSIQRRCRGFWLAGQ